LALGKPAMALSYLIHGAEESYYTGKLEAYLRAKGIAYELRPFGPASMRYCAKHTGVVQIPQVECSDGTWLVDTTLIIEHFERIQPEPRILPADAAVRFVSHLLEDYADEWLWRPAMHYRWSYPETARLMSGWLGEHLAELPTPMFSKKAFWRIRQRMTFVRRDGVTAATRRATDAVYLDTLGALESILRTRSFIMGERPTPADFGFFASMFRHFSSDPTPARIMRRDAPAVYEWVARLWNISPAVYSARPMPERIATDLRPLLDAVVEAYLPYLEANESAFAAGARRVRYPALGVTWEEPTKPYRVWCLDRLRRQFDALDPAARAAVETAVGAAAMRVLASPSRGVVPSVVDPLPISGRRAAKPVDSWWRAA
jgi:glutathione S-transferase